MKQRIIPKNIIEGKRILGFHKRNLVEGIIAAFFVIMIIRTIPFVPLVKRVTSICIGFFVFIINCLGIKGQSFSQALINYLAYRKLLNQYSYRLLKDAPESEDVFEYDEYGNRFIKGKETAISKAKKFLFG